MRFYLGVDAGGTSTIAVVMDHKNKIISRYCGDVGNFDASEYAGENLLQVVTKAVKNYDIRSACFGIAGIDSEHDKRNSEMFLENSGIKKLLRCSIRVVNDIELILPSVTKEKRGIAVIGGTGSNFYAVNGIKKSKAGGVGNVLSDEGSAYDIGLKVLRAAVKSYDGRGPKTTLEKLVFRQAHAKDILELKDRMHKYSSKKEIARYAPLSEKAQDSVGKKILSDAALEYAAGIKSVMKNAGLLGKFGIAFTGGLFINNVLTERVKKLVKNFAPEAKFHIVKEPAIGAARIAINCTS